MARNELMSLCLSGLLLGASLAGIAGCSSSAGRTSGAPSSPAVAQQGVIADPGFLEQFAATYRFSLGKPTSIKPTHDGSAVLFLRSGPRTPVRDLYEFDTATGQERLLLTAEQILRGAEEDLTPEELARRERMRMTARGIASYALSQDGSRILFNLSGQLYVVERATGAVTELRSDAGFPIDARFSPDGSKVACVREGEVFVFDIETRQEHRVTTGAGGTVTNGVSEFVAQEEMGRFEGYWWSPDAMRIAYQQTDTAGLETMHIMDATRPEIAPNTWPYPRPGKKNADVRLGIISSSGGETTWIDWDREQYEYLATVKWEKNSPLTILVQNREQTEQVLLAVDEQTGYTTPLLTERDDAWLNLEQSMPKWLPDGSGFLWMTERNGDWQLELRDRDGSLDRAVTPIDLGLVEFVSLDHDRAEVVVTATAGNPTERHLFRLPLEPAAGAAERLTRRPGMHSAVFAKDHSIYVHTVDALDGEQSSTVRRGTDGEVVGQLQSRAEAPAFEPNLELTTAGRSPRFHVAVLRPRNFEPGRKYPVVVHVYGGPHAQYVTASRQRYLLQQWIADHGFIVVSIDGRGTPNRGRAWERVIKGDLIDISLRDQAEALKALGASVPEMDLSRVGVFGWSFGGYFSAMAVMRRPEVFHVGVAGAPVVDWMDYDTHYTERYMGLPQNNASGYEAANVLTHAPQLGRPLLVIHGTADDNVYFMHSLKLIDALFRAGRKAEFLPLPNFTHMVPDPLVTTRLYTRIVDFLLENLEAR